MRLLFRLPPRPLTTSLRSLLAFICWCGSSCGPRCTGRLTYGIQTLTICTLSATLKPDQITLTCMLNVLLAAVGGRLAFRLMAAFGGITAALLAQKLHMDVGRRIPQQLAHLYVLELVVARLSLVPLLVDVVYAQAATHPALRTGETVAAFIVAFAPWGVDWGQS